MDENLVKFLLKGAVSANFGPTAKEIMLFKAEEEYNNGNLHKSIFYQIRALYQALEERFYQLESINEETQPESEMMKWEIEDMKSNALMQHVMEKVRSGTRVRSEIDEFQSCNFLRNIIDPVAGVKKIEEICLKLPEEWTVLQLCKGITPQSTYSTFSQIHESDAAIYLTILRHARTLDYAAPICLRFTGTEQVDLFKKYACIANRFKQCINVDPKTCNTKETKKKYWDSLSELNQYIAVALTELKNFIYPWKFLFSGKPKEMSQNDFARIFGIVDEFCDRYGWEVNERILLSLAAQQAIFLSEFEIHAICNTLSSNGCEQTAASDMLKQLKNNSDVKAPSTSENRKKQKQYPCILVIDERLDHIFWEEINVEQEFSRVNSLQCLNRLYQLYRERIHNGYLKVNITNGGCVVNPDNNLPKTELRMRQFLEYWMPHWRLKFTEKPTQEEMLDDFFKRPCFVYAGHGSGLQYLNGKHIAKQRMNCVVFLFGCDSSRLHSTGLYSELVGTHLFYHAAYCPTLVGTIMPALDAYMDMVATEILSRWISPNSKHVLPWNEIHSISWVKEGIIKPQVDGGAANAAPTIANTPTYLCGSLCSILARVHQRINEPKYYNTVPYVCRGLPAWNCDAEPLP